MINLVYAFHFLECGHFCINYILKKEGKKSHIEYERRLMSLFLLKKVLNEYFDCVECYRIDYLEKINKRFVTLIKSRRSYHYIVVEKIKNNKVIYYDPLFLLLRKVNIKKFKKRWSKYCCVYS